MRLVYSVLLPLVAVLAALYAYTFTLPRQCEVQQSVVVQSTPDNVFQYINNPTQWEFWTVWNKNYDPSMIRMFGGPMSGIGARHMWSGDKLGNSLILFTESLVPEALNYEQTQEGVEHKTYGEFRLEKLEEGTRITWSQRSEIGESPVALLMGIWKKKKTEEELSQGLASLKTLIENSSKKRAAK